MIEIEDRKIIDNSVVSWGTGGRGKGGYNGDKCQWTEACFGVMNT